MTIETLYLPDTGSSQALEVIELLVKVGDRVTENQAILTLESDKATVDVPAGKAGVIQALNVKIGDKIAQGDAFAQLQSDSVETQAVPATAQAPEAPTVSEAPAEPNRTPTAAAPSTVKLPNTGSPNPVTVIELCAQPGDPVEAGQTLCILESDKATMDVPAPFAGQLQQWLISVGAKVNSDDDLAIIVGQSTEKPLPSPAAEKPAAPKQPVTTPASQPAETPQTLSPPATVNSDIYAGPAVRRMARILDVDLSRVKGTGDKGRISKDDIERHIKQLVQQAQNPPPKQSGFSLPQAPAVDFSLYGPIESKPLSRIKKLTAQNLSRNWLLAPHVTQFEESDITELEAFRKSQSAVYDKQGLKLTPLVFIMKAVVAALKAAPTFNASLDASGEQLILKKYFHLGIAVDTPDGLVVPVIRDVDQKSLSELAKELAEISVKARNQKLTSQDMQGSCFTISSLGGIGGTAFTPIINLPNVAILGVSKAAMKPHWDGQQFMPRLMLPLSLSYDHRVIDGAEAARFIVSISRYLQDIRLLLL